MPIHDRRSWSACSLVQRRGTERIGALFGPVMVVWFVDHRACSASAGSSQDSDVLVGRQPAARRAASSRDNGFHGFLVLGSVFLVVTGGEALYADMGHFGRRPIRLAWFGLVLPALLLNYFGQGALLLQRRPRRRGNPFYLPGAALGAAIRWSRLATVAAVIASQALISGAFSLTRQAMQLGYCPRLDIQHTSPHQKGQIYIPQVNWLLMVATVGLVVGFRSSSALAAAYGIAVTAHGDHHAARVSGGAAIVGCEAAGGRLARVVLPGHRAGFLRRQRHQDPARRLVPAGHRRR